MQGKTVAESEAVLARMMQPADANPAGNVHGGAIMKMVDEAGGVVSTRHSRCRCVTVTMDSMTFLEPIYIGDMVTVNAHITYVGKTSMEIEARVEAENLFTGKITHTSTCYLVFVAIDEHGRPAEVPSLILETEEEKTRWNAAQLRRKRRLEKQDAS